MTGTSHIITTIQKDGKRNTQALTISNNVNLKSYIEASGLNGYKVISVFICNTFKEAKQKAEEENAFYKKHDMYFNIIGG